MKKSPRLIEIKDGKPLPDRNNPIIYQFSDIEEWIPETGNYLIAGVVDFFLCFGVQFSDFTGINIGFACVDENGDILYCEYHGIPEYASKFVKKCLGKLQKLIQNSPVDVGYGSQ